jgi:hypothetical protein
VGGVWQGCGYNLLSGQQTLKVEYSAVNSYRERAVIFVIDANDGPLQSDAAATRTSLHLLFRLKNQTKRYSNFTNPSFLNLSPPSHNYAQRCYKLKTLHIQQLLFLLKY